jgi:hypothetical protein
MAHAQKYSEAQFDDLRFDDCEMPRESIEHK